MHDARTHHDIADFEPFQVAMDHFIELHALPIPDDLEDRDPAAYAALDDAQERAFDAVIAASNAFTTLALAQSRGLLWDARWDEKRKTGTQGEPTEEVPSANRHTQATGETENAEDAPTLQQIVERLHHLDAALTAIHARDEANAPQASTEAVPRSCRDWMLYKEAVGELVDATARFSAVKEAAEPKRYAAYETAFHAAVDALAGVVDAHCASQMAQAFAPRGETTHPPTEGAH